MRKFEKLEEVIKTENFNGIERIIVEAYKNSIKNENEYLNLGQVSFVKAKVVAKQLKALGIKKITYSSNASTEVFFDFQKEGLNLEGMTEVVTYTYGEDDKRIDPAFILSF